MFDLDCECLKDVLLHLKGKLDYQGKSSAHKQINWITVYKDENLLKNYTENQLKYTIEKLVEANFVSAKFSRKTNGEIIYLFISDITTDGFEFLETAKNDTLWNQTKDLFKGIGCFTFDVLKQVTSAVLTSHIKLP